MLKTKNTQAEQVSNTGCDPISYSFIFIADTHGFLNDFTKQKEVLEQVQPEYVLAEQLQNKILDTPEKYIQLEKERKISETVSWEEVSKLIHFCKDRDIILVGMDFINFGFTPYLQKVVNGEKEPTADDEKELEKIIGKRQKKHLEICREYKGKTNRPIVVIVGAWHLQDTSPLMQELNNYLVIFPVAKDGTMVLSPVGEREQISYGQKSKP